MKPVDRCIYSEFEFQIDEKPNGCVIRLNNEFGICVLRICQIPKELIVNEKGSIREFIDIPFKY